MTRGVRALAEVALRGVAASEAARLAVGELRWVENPRQLVIAVLLL